MGLSSGLGLARLEFSGFAGLPELEFKSGGYVWTLLLANSLLLLVAGSRGYGGVDAELLIHD